MVLAYVMYLEFMWEDCNAIFKRFYMLIKILIFLH